MNIFVCWEIDRINESLEAHVFANELEPLRQLSFGLEKLNYFIKQWVQSQHGKVIFGNGAKGCFEIPSDRGHELRVLSDKFQEIASQSGTIGIGLELSNAGAALKHGKANGGAIVMYEDSMGSGNSTESSDPQNLSGLTKAQGVPGIRDSGRAAPLPPNSQTGDGSQGSTLEPAPYPTQDPATTQAMPAGAAKAPAEAPTPEGEPEDPRKEVIAALQEIKQAAPILEQIKQQSPETYKAVMDIVQAMITMAEKMAGGDDGSTTD